MAESASIVSQRNNIRVLGRTDGPAVVFAHGFGCDQNMWRRIIPAFVDGYRVILFDHVGAGHSDSNAYDRAKYATLDGYVADLLEVCDAMDLHEVILVAHSVATMMAVLAAVAEPSRFQRLILVAPSPSYIDDPDDGYLGGFSRADIDGLLESLDSNYFAWSAAIAPMVMGNPQTPSLAGELTESFCRTDPDTARGFARVTFLSDTRAHLDKVRVPSLILQCSEDLLAPSEVGDYLHHHLSGSTLVQLNATGHIPQASAPEETATAILDYLQEVQR